jgi:competence protein ComEC
VIRSAAATAVAELLEPRAPDLRLVPAALAAWGSCAVAVGLPPSTSGRLAAACVALAVPCAVLGRGRWPAGRWRGAGAVVLVLGVVAVSVSAAGWRVAARTAGVAGPLLQQEATVEVVALVRTDPHVVRPEPGRPRGAGADRWVVRVLAEQMSGRGEHGEVRVPLVVLGGPGWDAVQPGERVRVTGRLVGTEPGDAAAALLVVRGPPQPVSGPGEVMAGATRLREGLRLACAGLPPDARGLLPSLVVGDTSGLPPDLEQDMRTTGLTHLSAVSGANFTLVCGTVLVVSTAAGVGRLPRLAVAALAAVGFVVLARPEPSVLRAAVMGLVGLLGLAGSRRAVGVPALSVAVVGLCVVDPWLSRSAGFALSVLATGGLLLLAGPWTRALARLVPTWVAAALAVPLAAQAVCSPVTVLLTPQLSLVAVPANVLVAPAVAPATVLGVVAALLAPFWPTGAAGVAWLGGWAVRWIALVARHGADLPHAAVPWPEGAGGAALLAGATLLGAAVVALLLRAAQLRVPSGDEGPPAAAPTGGRAGLRPRPVHGLVAGSLLCAAGVQLGLADPVLVQWFPGASRWPGAWQVAACDVGQGQALAVRTGEASAVVVDAGPDAGLVDRCLDDLGVVHVDLLALSHFHADHVDGLAGVLDGRSVAQVVVSPLAEPAAGARRVAAELAATGLVATAPASGTVITVGPAAAPVVVEVLGPVPPFDTGGGDESGERAANDASLVLHVRTPTTTLLATGDIEPPAQRALDDLLVQRPDLLPVDVVSVAHHGSAQQHAPLYRRLRARVALVSAGRDNDYGHPAPAALELLDGTGALVARTDLGGALSVGGDADGLWVDGARDDPVARPP